MNKPSLLVLGASSDLGRALIRRYLDRDMRVLAHYYSNPATFHGCKAEVIPLQADLTSMAEVDALIERIQSNYGCPQRLVHFAAEPVRYTRFPQVDWDDFERGFQVQVRSLLLLLRAFVPEMTKGTEMGKIVFVLSSVTIGAPPKNLVPYTMIKYAALGLMKALASEYQGKNVSFNAVSPSMVKTGFLRDVPSKLVEIVAAQSPYLRIAEVDDIVPIVEFLLEPGSNYLSGTNIPATAGQVF